MILEELNVNKEDALFVKIKSIRERLVIELAKKQEDRSKMCENQKEIQEFFYEEREKIQENDEKNQEKYQDDANYIKNKKYYNSFLNHDL